MQERRQKLRRELNWSRIPAARRHVYVYALLLLGAVVGNNLRTALVGAPQNDGSVEQGQVSRMEGTKENTRALYH